MKKIAVFCGASNGYDPLHYEVALEVGNTLAAKGFEVIYGGAKIGLMGAVADGVLANEGKITGIMPSFLQTVEITHTGLTELIIVATMHERKLKMHELSDAVMILPGGWGTMEEMFEMLTWAQMGLHSKPVGLLNVNGYYEALKALCDNMVQEGFLNEFTRSMLLTSDDISDLLEQMTNYIAPPTTNQIEEETT
ncbi:MAG: TIGR00730 family Rossman fold protein [Taibaiella sp.]|nr:TIGR00730 family Rossman fold protein [Taibaiella sp.]